MSDLIKGEPLNHSFARIINKDCAVEDRRTSEIFLTRPEYLNRLFKGIGYKNRNVVTILDEYANMTVDKADEDMTDQIYVDRDNFTCFVSTKEDILKMNTLYLKVCETYGKDNVEVSKSDDYYYWDQVAVKINCNVSFVFYFDLCNRYVAALTVIRNDEGLVIDICSEGKFKIEEEDFVNNLLLSLESSISLTPSQVYLNDENFKLSVNETVEFLNSLGLVHKKRGKAYISDDVTDDIIERYRVLDVIDLYNSKKSLARRVCFEDSCFSIQDIENLVTDYLSFNLITPWRLLGFYQSIDNEGTDYFQLID